MNTSDKQRRLKRLAIAHEFVTGVLKVVAVPYGRTIQEIVVEDPLPSDVEFVRSFDDPGRGCVWIVLRHDSFDVVGSGAVIPEVNPMPAISVKYVPGN